MKVLILCSALTLSASTTFGNFEPTTEQPPLGPIICSQQGQHITFAQALQPLEQSNIVQAFVQGQMCLESSETSAQVFVLGSWILNSND